MDIEILEGNIYPPAAARRVNVPKPWRPRGPGPEESPVARPSQEVPEPAVSTAARGGALVIAACSSRKMTAPEIAAKDLPSGNQQRVSQAWQTYLATASPSAPCRAMYRGRGLRIAAGAAERIGAGLAVVSAGLGYVRSDTVIPSYDLTLSASSVSSVPDKVTGSFSASSWWADVLQGPYSSAIADDLDASLMVLVTVSRSYMEPLIDGLISFADRSDSTLRIFGEGIGRALPDELLDFVMPYDSRLNAAPRNGTRIDFASRALLHYIEEVLPSTGGVLRDDQRTVKEMMDAMQPTSSAKPNRKLGDAELIETIRTLWLSTEMTQSAMLTYLRHTEHIACEQSRFRGLYARATSGKSNA